MDQPTPTVRIKAPHVDGGYIVIDERDLRPEHELFDTPQDNATVPASKRATVRKSRSKTE